MARPRAGGGGRVPGLVVPGAQSPRTAVGSENLSGTGATFAPCFRGSARAVLRVIKHVFDEPVRSSSRCGLPGAWRPDQSTAGEPTDFRQTSVPMEFDRATPRRQNGRLGDSLGTVRGRAKDVE